MTPLDCGPCTIRPWLSGDVKALMTHGDNYAVWKNLRDVFPRPYSRAAANWWIKHTSHQNPQVDFAIAVQNEVVGGIGVRPLMDVERCSAEIGYWIGEAFWGRGIATAALIGFTPYAMERYNLARLYATPFATNIGSRRVLEKAGYRLEGIMQCAAIKENHLLDLALYACTTPLERYQLMR